MKPSDKKFVYKYASVGTGHQQQGKYFQTIEAW